MLKITIIPRENLRFPRRGWRWGKVANHSAMGWAESINGSKNLAIVHGRVRDDASWGGKHLVTNGVA